MQRQILSSNLDLFKAIKGGSNNFGVVTRFDIEKFEQGPLWGGILAFPFDQLPQLMQRLEAFTIASGNGEDDSASMEATVAFNASGGISTGWIGAHTNAKPYPSIFKNFTDIEPQLAHSLRTANLSNLMYEAGAGLQNEVRWFMATLTFGTDAAFHTDLVALCQRIFQIPTKSQATYYFVLEPLTRAFTKRSALRGGNALGLDGKRELILLDFSGAWTDPADDAAIDVALNKFFDEATALAKSRGQHREFIYIGYA